MYKTFLLDSPEFSESAQFEIGCLARYSVFVKDSDSLKTTEDVSNRIISGDYLSLASHLEIRFGAENATASSAAGISASEATLNDEWEVEVSGLFEEVDNSSVNSIKMTRRY